MLSGIVPPFACPSETWFCGLVIFVQKTMETTRKRAKRKAMTFVAMSLFQTQINPIENPMIQNQVIATTTRFGVTTGLYLSPNNRARSLSTCVSVDVITDTYTTHKFKLKAKHVREKY